jgi:hypothetical protein
LTVNEKSVLPFCDTFWMITSTSMLASATAPRIGEATPGLSGTPAR